MLRCISSLLILSLLAITLRAQEGKKVALLVGVQKYSEGSGLRNLDYTEKDVTDLAAVLEKAGYKVTMLTRSEATKQDKDFLRPTAKNIKNQLKAITADRNTEDTVLLAFTGHGAHLKKTNKLYYCPAETDLADEATMIAVDDVMTALNKENCKAAAKVLLMDACRNDPADGRAGGGPPELQSVTRPLLPEPPGGTVALFSCSTGQISHESTTFKRGFLFHHVIEGLSGKAASKKSGEVTWTGLSAYVCEELPESVRKDMGPNVKQTPEVRGDARAMVLAKYEVANVDLGSIKPMKPMAVMPKPEVATIVGEPKPGEERSIEIATDVKMVFCWIPPGKATLGSPGGPDGEATRKVNEDEHEYQSKGFWLGKYAVTQEEWTATMKSKPFLFQNDGKNEDFAKRVKGMDTSRFPADVISWNDSQKMITELNALGETVKVFGQAGRFTLPHEEEWEYACRGGRGNQQPFYWGKSLNGDKANCNGSQPYGTDIKGENKERPMPVGSYAHEAPHPWGLCDMLGNMSQWCENTHPLDPTKRMMRGGSWYDVPEECRAAIRFNGEPDRRFANYGFRVCYRPD